MNEYNTEWQCPKCGKRLSSIQRHTKEDCEMYITYKQ